MVEYRDGLIETLAALNRLNIAEGGLDETLAKVAELAVDVIPNCQSAGVTMLRNRVPQTVAYSGSLALAIDTVQYEADSGPCLDAYRTKTIVLVDHLPDATDRWPEVAARAEELGVLSSLSIPLVSEGTGIGALNLYSPSPRGFDEDVELASVFCEQASISIANADAYWRTYNLTTNLQTALENRDLIGQAKGVLMSQRKVLPEEAFALLRTVSQAQNIKLRDVADHVVRTGELPSEADPGPIAE